MIEEANADVNHRFVEVEIFDSHAGELAAEAIQTAASEKSAEGQRSGIQKLSDGSMKLVLVAQGSTAEKISGQIGPITQFRQSIVVSGVETPSEAEAQIASYSLANIFVVSVYHALGLENMIPSADLFGFTSRMMPGIGLVLVFRFNVSKAFAAARMAMQAEIAA